MLGIYMAEELGEGCLLLSSVIGRNSERVIKKCLNVVKWNLMFSFSEMGLCWHIQRWNKNNNNKQAYDNE